MVGSFGVFILSLLGSFVLGTLLLMLVAKIFKQSNVFVPSVKVSIIVAFLGAIINILPLGNFLSFILGLGLIVFNVYLIKRFFNVNTGKAVGMWFVLLGFTTVLVLIAIVALWSIIANSIQQSIPANF